MAPVILYCIMCRLGTALMKLKWLRKPKSCYLRTMWMLYWLMQTTGWRKNAAGKLLVITNAGAHYPPTGTTYNNTLFHSLNHNLYSFMTGRLCGNDTKKAIAATSYYDGGYQHCHAMATAYTTAGGDIQFNFVSHYKKQEFIGVRRISYLI